MNGCQLYAYDWVLRTFLIQVMPCQISLTRVLLILASVFFLCSHPPILKRKLPHSVQLDTLSTLLKVGQCFFCPFPGDSYAGKMQFWTEIVIIPSSLKFFPYIKKKPITFPARFLRSGGDPCTEKYCGDNWSVWGLTSLVSHQKQRAVRFTPLVKMWYLFSNICLKIQR